MGEIVNESRRAVAGFYPNGPLVIRPAFVRACAITCISISTLSLAATALP